MALLINKSLRMCNTARVIKLHCLNDVTWILGVTKHEYCSDHSAAAFGTLEMWLREENRKKFNDYKMPIPQMEEPRV